MGIRQEILFVIESIYPMQVLGWLTERGNGS